MQMNVNVYLFTYNDEVLVAQAVKHYQTWLPRCTVTVVDNESTDQTIQIAKTNGAMAKTWRHGTNELNEFALTQVKNNIWKQDQGWVIVADCDEFLCVTHEDLEKEQAAGTTLLMTRGLQMVGDSQRADLSDIDVSEIRLFELDFAYDKPICFFRPAFHDMNFNLGTHICNPVPRARQSKKIYLLKHMNWLGEAYIVQKHLARYVRATRMREEFNGIAGHYMNDAEAVAADYRDRRRRVIMQFI